MGSAYRERGPFFPFVALAPSEDMLVDAKDLFVSATGKRIRFVGLRKIDYRVIRAMCSGSFFDPPELERNPVELNRN